MFVLLTKDNEYILEYLFNELVLTKHIEKAKEFDSRISAFSFKDQLQEELNLEVSVNTYIK